MQVYDKANLGDAMEVDEEEGASATEEPAQLPGPEEMEEDAEEEEAEAEEQEQELTLADVVSEAEAAATEAQGVVELNTAKLGWKVMALKMLDGVVGHVDTEAISR